MIMRLSNGYHIMYPQTNADDETLIDVYDIGSMIQLARTNRDITGLPWEDLEAGVECGAIIVDQRQRKVVLDAMENGLPIKVRISRRRGKKRTHVRACTSQELVDAIRAYEQDQDILDPKLKSALGEGWALKFLNAYCLNFLICLEERETRIA